MKNKTITKLKQDIELKQSYLNKVIIEEIEKVEVIRISQELDTLITEYIYKTIWFINISLKKLQNKYFEVFL